MKCLPSAAVVAVLLFAVLLCGPTARILAAPELGVNPNGGRTRAPTTCNSLNTTLPVVALTFDDGPHPELTPKLLDILRLSGVPATFYMVGSKVEAYPEIARRVESEGHELGNHSWSHPQLPSLDATCLREEIERTNDALLRATGTRPASMRPPYGIVDDRVRQAILNDQGLDLVFWSVDPFDWDNPGAEVVRQRIVNGTEPGDIILAHDNHPGTIEAMPGTIQDLRDRGYAFVRVSELMALQEDSPALAVCRT